jgi:hypothetical protein
MSDVGQGCGADTSAAQPSPEWSAMMLEQNDEWALQRRYMYLEGLQTLTEPVPTRLSAVAR